MKISVILPVYNKSNYVSNMLSDISRQTFCDFECLVIDDGSTDGSEDLCDQYALIDSRFQVFHTDNNGVSHARNIGLDHARGEYITFVDADDRLDKTFLQVLYQDMIASQADMVIGNLKKVWLNEHAEDCQMPYKGLLSLEEFLPHFARNQKETGIYGWCCAKMIPVSLIRGKRFDEKIKLGEDLDWYLKIYPNVRTIYFENQSLYLYLQQTENSPLSEDDYSIDYYTQLQIQLRMQNFLIEKQAYNSENKKISEQMIEGYTYACIFYCKLRNLKEQFQKLQQIQKENPIVFEYNSLERQGRLENVLLFLFQHRMFFFTWLLLLIYRGLRIALRSGG